MNTVLLSLGYLANHSCVDFQGNHGRPPSAQEGRLWKAHKSSVILWCVSSNAQGGWIWLLKLFNKKRVLQTETKAIEQVQKIVKGH